jgi:hypothetical protein
LVHFGHHHYGKVDVVPDLCYVVTRFVHVNFLPVFPLESRIIVVGMEKDGNYQGVKTTLSLKSIFVAWLRALLFVVVLGSAMISIMLTIDFFRGRPGEPAIVVEGAWCVTILAGVAIWLTYRFNRAGYARALQLGTELGLEAEFVEHYLPAPEDDRAAAPAPAKEPEGWERYR